MVPFPPGRGPVIYECLHSAAGSTDRRNTALSNGQGFETLGFPTLRHNRHGILIGATESDGRVPSFEEVQVQHAVGVLITGTQKVLH